MNGGNKDPYQKKIFTIPNVLTFVRIVLIPFIVLVYVKEEKYALAAVLYLVSAATDVLDGMIARGFNMVSDLGKALDPIADKLTQLSVLFCLAFRYRAMILPLVFLAVKEFVSGLFVLTAIRRSGKVNGALWHGKLSTVMLFISIMFHLFWINIPSALSYLLIGMTLGAMAYSFIMYVRFNYRILKSYEKKGKENA